MRKLFNSLFVACILVVLVGGGFTLLNNTNQSADYIAPTPVEFHDQQVAEFGDSCALDTVLCPWELDEIINDHGAATCTWTEHEIVQGNQSVETQWVVVIVEWFDNGYSTTTAVNPEKNSSDGIVYVNGVQGVTVTVHTPDTCTLGEIQTFIEKVLQFPIVELENLMKAGVLGGEIRTSP